MKQWLFGSVAFTGLFLGAVFSQTATATERALFCENGPAPEVSTVEVVNDFGRAHIMVYAHDGSFHQLDLDEEISVELESVIPLPVIQGVERSLQLRHTGWVVNAYGNQGTNRSFIDCE